MNDFKYLVLFSVIIMFFSCKKDSNGCNLDNAQLYSQTELKIYAYESLEGTCQQGLNATEIVTVLDCECAIVFHRGRVKY